jgi:hypothetical protein
MFKRISSRLSSSSSSSLTLTTARLLSRLSGGRLFSSLFSRQSHGWIRNTSLTTRASSCLLAGILFTFASSSSSPRTFATTATGSEPTMGELFFLSKPDNGRLGRLCVSLLHKYFNEPDQFASQSSVIWKNNLIAKEEATLQTFLKDHPDTAQFFGVTDMSSARSCFGALYLCRILLQGFPKTVVAIAGPRIKQAASWDDDTIQSISTEAAKQFLLQAPNSKNVELVRLLSCCLHPRHLLHPILAFRLLLLGWLAQTQPTKHNKTWSRFSPKFVEKFGKALSSTKQRVRNRTSSLQPEIGPVSHLSSLHRARALFLLFRFHMSVTV